MARSLFVFRRDLRLEDNTALNAALNTGTEVVPVFVIDQQLIKRWSGAEKRLAFLFQSLHRLETAIRKKGGQLLIAEGDPAELIPQLATANDVKDVYFNREYTPFGRRRDQHMTEACEQAKIRCHVFDDLLLNPPAAVLKNDGNPYVVYTPYFRKASQLQVAAPASLAAGKFAKPGSKSALEDLDSVGIWLNTSLGEFEPGENGARLGLDRLSSLADYGEQRDIPATGQTSRLSPHMRFGTCSPRQFHLAVYQAHGHDHPLIRQLYWRDFYHQIAWYYPHVFGHAFRAEYDTILWQEDEAAFEKWKRGETGFPIVDAGMRELLATGYMHNRVRMVVASFLTKNLHIDWRRGEAHFAEHLIDYEPAVNNGNWQWGASTGCDAQPYFRVFNPWRQQQRFDKDCAYIKTWVPELVDYPAQAIHKLEKTGDFYRPQIADLKKSAEAIKLAFKEAAIR